MWPLSLLLLESMVVWKKKTEDEEQCALFKLKFKHNNGDETFEKCRLNIFSAAKYFVDLHLIITWRKQSDFALRYQAPAWSRDSDVDVHLCSVSSRE